MKNIKFITLALFALVIVACKKEDIKSQEVVQKHLIGKWPLKYRVEITYKNNKEISNDTISYLPPSGTPQIVDTLVFTADGKFTKDNETVDFKVDETGENITFLSTPPSEWFIKYLRLKSIALSQEKTEKIGNDTFRYYVEEQLIK